jgi:hypothetical protein
LRIVLFTLLFTACATTSNIVKHQELPPLPATAEVYVHTEKMPDYTFEVVCEANVEGYMAGYQLKSYEAQAKSLARKCGTDTALVESVSSYGERSMARIKAILKKSEDSKLVDTETIKKIATAASLNNVGNLKELLKNTNLNKDPKQRSNIDTSLLETLVLKLADKAQSCPKKAIDFLMKDYGIYLSGVETQGSIYVSTGNVLNCNSPVIAKSYTNFKNKEDSIFAINNAITESMNRSYTSLYKVAYSNYLKLYPQIIKDVETSCGKDPLSRLCSMKPNLQELNKFASKLK